MARKTGDPAGSQLGRMIVQLISDTIIKSHAGLSPAEAEMKRRSLTETMEQWEKTFGARGAELINILQGPDVADNLKAHLSDVMGSPINSTDILYQVILLIPFVVLSLGRMIGIIEQPFINNLMAENQNFPLSLADAINLTIVGEWDIPTGQKEASFSGISAGRFDALRYAALNVPDAGTSIEAFRRQQIDSPTLISILERGGLDPIYIPLVLSTVYGTMSPADAIETYVKGYTTRDEALDYFTQGGGVAAQFDLLSESGGSSIGLIQAGSLYNHGLIDEATFKLIILHSNIHPQFEAVAELTRIHYLQPYQIMQVLKSGGVDDATATTWLKELGYPDDQSAAIVKAGTSGATKTAKALTESLILDLYEAGMTTSTEVITELVGIGYKTADAVLIVESYDARKILTLKQAAINAIAKAFKAGRLAQSDASNQLDSLGVDPAWRDASLATWAIEAQDTLPTLTTAQIGLILQNGGISGPDAISAWVNLGWDQSDAALLTYAYKSDPTAAAEF